MFYFSLCPVCDCPLSSEVGVCRRCGADLALLTKVRIIAEELKAEGKVEQSHALYRDQGHQEDAARVELRITSPETTQPVYMSSS